MGIKTAVIRHGAALVQNRKLGLQHLLWQQVLSWPVTVGLLVMSIYLGLLPFVAQTWQATGDEPHYLLAAHSLVNDLDFDLTNNYAQFDYLNFYFSRDIAPQIWLDADGRQILSHYPGLPVLIAPAYALGGRFGVLLFQSILGGLLAILTFKLAHHISGDAQASLLATLFVTLTPPVLFYNYLIYPEMVAALLVTLTIYYVVTRQNDEPNLNLPVLFSLAALPWLNRRFIPLAIILALLVIWYWWGGSQGCSVLRLFVIARRILPKQSLACNTGIASSASLPRNDTRRIFRTEQPWGRSSSAGLLTPMGAATLITITVSIGLILWWNSQLFAPAHADITAPTGLFALWSRLLRGSVGWLVDQQRGLFIFAPIYITALWGIPILIQRSRIQRDQTWLVMIPFGVSLAVVIVAGGYWVAWELGPRFLVVALPTVAPLLALTWQSYRHKALWVGATLLLFAISLSNSWVILQNPELPYKSSLPLYYGERLALPLTEFLPDLAEHFRLSPAATDLNPHTPAIDQEWSIPAGKSGNLVPPKPLTDLPFGHYILNWPLRIEPGISPNAKLARISIKYLGGGQLFNQTITAADLPADGSYGTIEANIFNANVDRWRTPMILHAVNTGQHNLWIKDLWLKPNPFYAIVLPYLLLFLLGVGAVLTWYKWYSPLWGNGVKLTNLPLVRPHPNPLPKGEGVKFPSLWEGLGEGLSLNLIPLPQKGDLPVPVRIERDNQLVSSKVDSPQLTGRIWGIVALVALAAIVGYLIYTQSRSSFTYDAESLSHFVGQPVRDSDAHDNRAWFVDPATDPPQKAIYGPFEFFDAGTYRVTYRLKLPEMVETGQEIARLQVNATANFDEIVTQPIFARHFSKPDLYHDMVLIIHNPRRQALSFDLHYLGVTSLLIDEVIITKIDE